MELFRACDVMSIGSPETIHSQENVAKLAKMLLRTGHSGFPVVKYDEETRTEVAYGLITRPVGCDDAICIVFVLHRVSIIFCHQEARLPQTDRATRCVSRNLVSK